MEPLRTEFEDRTFRYTQIERHGDLAIYRQPHKAGQVDRYEVVRIRVLPEHTWPTGAVSPEREAYPGANAWGTLGWTVYDLPTAQAQLQQLQGAAMSPTP